MYQFPDTASPAEEKFQKGETVGCRCFPNVADRHFGENSMEMQEKSEFFDIFDVLRR